MKFLSASVLLILAGCSQPTLSPSGTDGKTVVYDCGATENPQSLVVNYRDGKAWVFSAGSTLQLSKAVSASGEKYSDMNGNIFWLHHGEVLADIDDKQYRNCRINHRESIWQAAKLRGVDYRAVGQEPPWTLEISNRDHLQIFIGYERTMHSFTLPKPESDIASRTTRYNTADVQLTITGDKCHDSMSGEAFESSVQVTVANNTYRGCGRALH